jgi:WD40 repeat protein
VLRFSPDGQTLLIAGGLGGQSGTVVGVDTNTWTRRFTFTDDSDAILTADLDSAGHRVVYGGPTRLVKVLQVADGKLLHTFRKSTDWVLSTRFSPDGLLVAAGDRFGGIHVWAAKSGQEFLTLRGHTKVITSLAWRADSESLASTSDDGTVRVWNMHTGEETKQWIAHQAGVLDLHWQNTDLLTSGRDKMIRVWKANGEQLHEYGPASDEVLRITMLPTKKVILSGDWSGQIQSWGAESPSVITLPMKLQASVPTSIKVPVPELAKVTVAQNTLPTKVTSASDLNRKRETLKSIEAAAERMKDEAARDPKNTSLAKAYLQLCEAALAMKAEVLAAESQENKK